MVWYVFALLAFVVLILFWFDREFAIWGKFLATAICGLIWAAYVAEPLFGMVLHAMFGLGLYFLMYPSNWVSNR